MGSDFLSNRAGVQPNRSRYSFRQLFSMVGHCVHWNIRSFAVLSEGNAATLGYFDCAAESKVNSAEPGLPTPVQLLWLEEHLDET